MDYRVTAELANKVHHTFVDLTYENHFSCLPSTHPSKDEKHKLPVQREASALGSEADVPQSLFRPAPLFESPAASIPVQQPIRRRTLQRLRTGIVARMGMLLVRPLWQMAAEGIEWAHRLLNLGKPSYHSGSFAPNRRCQAHV